MKLSAFYQSRTSMKQSVTNYRIKKSCAHAGAALDPLCFVAAYQYINTHLSRETKNTWMMWSTVWNYAALIPSAGHDHDSTINVLWHLLRAALT